MAEQYDPLCRVIVATMGDNNALAMERIKRIVQQVHRDVGSFRWTCRFTKQGVSGTLCEVVVHSSFVEFDVWQEAALVERYRVVACGRYK